MARMPAKTGYFERMIPTMSCIVQLAHSLLARGDRPHFHLFDDRSSRSWSVAFTKALVNALGADRVSLHQMNDTSSILHAFHHFVSADILVVDRSAMALSAAALRHPSKLIVSSSPFPFARASRNIALVNCSLGKYHWLHDLLAASKRCRYTPYSLEDHAYTCIDA